MLTKVIVAITIVYIVAVVYWKFTRQNNLPDIEDVYQDAWDKMIEGQKLKHGQCYECGFVPLPFGMVPVNKLNSEWGDCPECGKEEVVYIGK